MQMYLRDRARRNVDREGDPNERCQYATNLAAGSSCKVKRAAGGEGVGIGGAGGGIDRDQRSDWAVLDPVRKGRIARGESKNNTDVLEKTARPSGRIRGETPNRVCDRTRSGTK